jgi:hypothetical protein
MDMKKTKDKQNSEVVRTDFRMRKEVHYPLLISPQS